MRRLWPTAEMAWRVAMSVGRAPERPRAGRPAAMAPEVTTTTRWPWVRRVATSEVSLSIAAWEISPRSSVIDDVPILATTFMDGSRSSGPPAPLDLDLLVDVLELETAHPHRVARAGAGPGQRPVDPEAGELVAHVFEGLGVGEVVDGHRPLRRLAEHDIGAVVGPRHLHAFGLGAVDDVG